MRSLNGRYDGDSRLIRTVSLLPVLLVLAIVGLEYYVFLSAHLVPGLQRVYGVLTALAWLLEATLFHFFVACMSVAYYKVVTTGAFVISSHTRHAHRNNNAVRD